MRCVRAAASQWMRLSSTTRVPWPGRGAQGHRVDAGLHDREPPPGLGEISAPAGPGRAVLPGQPWPASVTSTRQAALSTVAATV